MPPPIYTHTCTQGHLAECGCEGREEVMVVPSDQLDQSDFEYVFSVQGELITTHVTCVTLIL